MRLCAIASSVASDAGGTREREADDEVIPPAPARLVDRVFFVRDKKESRFFLGDVEDVDCCCFMICSCGLVDMVGGVDDVDDDCGRGRCGAPIVPQVLDIEQVTLDRFEE